MLIIRTTPCGFWTLCGPPLGRPPRHPEATTLTPDAFSELIIDVHRCQTRQAGNPMNAAELSTRLPGKKRKTTSELKQLLTTRSDQNPNFCLFLGAGASRNSGIRTAGEMMQSWRRSVYSELSGDKSDRPQSEMSVWLASNASEWYDPLKEYSSLFEYVFPLESNRRKFVETEVAEKIPSIGYTYLVRLAEAGLLRTIFTTNFDDLLNEAFYYFSHERALVCAHDSSVRTISITSRRAKIIKLHGDYLFESLKNTVEETRSLEPNMKEKLAEFLKEYGLIIAGYSGSDKSIVRNLGDMLDDSIYLRNGLFWCFREGDEVTPEALDILRRPNSFYVLIQGFDELMADLYSTVTDSTPFSSKLASDRASRVIETYINNPQLKCSASQIIKKHLANLETDRNATLVSDMMNDLNTERLAASGLSDQNLLVYLEIERALRDRDLESALSILSNELATTADQRFKAILLHRRFICAMRLYKVPEAKKAVKEALDLEPENYYMALSECSLLESRSDRITYLVGLKAKHPYSAPVLNRYAEECRRAVEYGDKTAMRIKAEDVQAALDRSLEVDPSLSNRAWALLFGFQAKQGPKSRESLADLLKRQLKQDAFRSETMAALVRYCRKFKRPEFDGRPLFEYLQEAYVRHFPRDYPSHAAVFVEACIEFGAIPALQKLIEDVVTKDNVMSDSEFIDTLITVYYDVCRDLPGAISVARNFLKTRKNVNIEQRLLELYIQKSGAGDKARQMHADLEGAIDHHQWLFLEAKLMEHEGRFQNAIDTVEALPDRRDFDEKYVSLLSFLELKLERYEKAFKRCKKFLEDRAFNIRYETEIINYEYAKKMDGGRIDGRRIKSVLETTENELTKGVCHSLLGQDKEAVKIFQEEAEKRFSSIDMCLTWPVISHHEAELRAIRQDLVRSKRSFNSLGLAALP